MKSVHSLRIAFIVTGDGESGTYFRYHNFAKGLVRLGHEVVVYGQRGGERWGTRREARDGVEYVLAPSAPGNSWIDYSINPGNLFWRLVQRIGRADVYHLFQPHENSALSWLALQKFRSREGALFEDHCRVTRQRELRGTREGRRARTDQRDAFGYVRPPRAGK